MAIIGLISNWDFTIEEMNNNVYLLTGTRITGETFSAQASEPHLKLKEMGAYAVKINLSYPKPDRQPYMFPYFDTELPNQISEDLEMLLLTEIFNGNYIQEYWTNWGKYISLHNKFTDQAIICCNHSNLTRTMLNDSHFGMSEVTSINSDWKILEPFVA